MDTVRAIEVLEWWAATAARAGRDGAVQRGTRLFSELQAREDQTRRVLGRALGLSSLPELMSPSMMNDDYWVGSGLRQVEYALGRLRTDAETLSILSGDAPTVQADALHDLIWEAASRRWEAGHFVDAVQRAATALSGLVKDRTGRYELGDNDLMRQAFALEPPQEGKPRLRWPGKDDDLSVKTMRIGMLNISQGVFSAIRNPASHSADELEKQEAFEQLATLSLLARWIDQCELAEAGTSVFRP